MTYHKGLTEDEAIITKVKIRETEPIVFQSDILKSMISSFSQMTNAINYEETNDIFDNLEETIVSFAQNYFICILTICIVLVINCNN